MRVASPRTPADVISGITTILKAPVRPAGVSGTFSYPENVAYWDRGTQRRVGHLFRQLTQFGPQGVKAIDVPTASLFLGAAQMRPRPDLERLVVDTIQHHEDPAIVLQALQAASGIIAGGYPHRGPITYVMGDPKQPRPLHYELTQSLDAALQRAWQLNGNTNREEVILTLEKLAWRGSQKALARLVDYYLETAADPTQTETTQNLLHTIYDLPHSLVLWALEHRLDILYESTDYNPSDAAVIDFYNNVVCPYRYAFALFLRRHGLKEDPARDPGYSYMLNRLKPSLSTNELSTYSSQAFDREWSPSMVKVRFQWDNRQEAEGALSPGAVPG